VRVGSSWQASLLPAPVAIFVRREFLVGTRVSDSGASAGGLKPSTRRLLIKVAADASARRPIQVTPEPALKPGTVLLREWHGTEHQVIVRENSVVFNGKQYKSLSAVAYRITGTKWSGPLFFGLKANRQEQSNGAT
jgi:hypothetical protein